MLKRFSLVYAVLYFFAFTSCQKNIDETTDPIIIPKVEIVNHLLGRSNAEGESIELGCYAIVLPFEVLDSFGQSYPISSPADFETLISNENIIVVDFKYPLSLKNVEGEIVLANNLEELANYFANCVPEIDLGANNIPCWDINFENSCYELIYPISLTKADSIETVSILNEEQYHAYVASGEYYFVFPLKFVDEEGLISSVNNHEELFNLLLSCNEINICDSCWSEVSFFNCYQAQYPLSLISEGNTTLVINNEESLINAFFQGNIIGFVFPFTLIGEKGDTVSVNNEIELGNTLNNCQLNVNVDFSLNLLSQGATGDSLINSSPCYTVEFPIQSKIQYTQHDIEEIKTLTSLIELMQLSNVPAYTKRLVYPITITLIKSNTKKVLNNDNDLFKLFIEDCN